MTEYREVYTEYASLTRELRAAAERVDLAEASRILDARQRLIDLAGTLGAWAAAPAAENRAVLEAAAADELGARRALEAERERFLAEFRELTKVRRAHGGYAALAAAPAPTTDHKA